MGLLFLKPFVEPNAERFGKKLFLFVHLSRLPAILELRMTQSILKCTFVAVSLFLAQHALAQPVVCYNPATGNITFNEFFGVSKVRLFSSGGNLIPDSGADLGFDLTEQTATLYSWIDFGAGITGNGLNTGNIVVPGTDVRDLIVDYTIGLAGSPFVGDIKTIPESSTLALAGLGLFGLTVKRRGYSIQH